MGNNKFKLDLKELRPNSYDKPKRKDEFVDAKHYDKVDDECEKKVMIGNDGKTYVDSDIFPSLFKCNKGDGQYIYDNEVPDDKKSNIGGKNFAHSSSVVGLLDQRVQETRDTQVQAVCMYGRDSLIAIGDSADAQNERRKFDGFAKKELPKLRKKRQVEHDEITGEPLEDGYEFHHKNKKSVITNPQKLIDPNSGINVNKKTHKEIHRRGIVDEKQLEREKENIKKTLIKNKKPHLK